MTGVSPLIGPVLLLGAAGQLGQALAPRLARLGAVVPLTRADVDLERLDDVRALVRRVRPGLVVNAAAYTGVDDAEGHEARCRLVNEMVPAVLAEETARLRVPLVHFSTNYVFDGLQPMPYTEDVPPSPLSVYGATKADGERAVAAANPRHLIVRAAAVYGGSGRTFMRRILELAREREELRVVDDQYVSPTPAWVLAHATVAAIDHLLAEHPAAQGLLHLTTTGAASWHAFALRILELDPDRAAHRVRSVVAVDTAGYPTPARRPANGVLDTGKAERELGIRLPGWEEALRRTWAGEGACR